MYPIFLRIGPVVIRFYGLMIAVAFITAIYVARKESIRKGLGPECMVDFGPYAIISGIIGARLYYVMLHARDFLMQPLDIVKVWEGGLAFHGGILGGFLAGIWFARKRAVPFWRFADAAVPSIILAQAIGRIGCFLNGCCCGKETAVPWAVTFRNMESMAPLNVSLHPTQIYEMAGNLAIFVLLWSIRRKKRPDGYLFLLYTIMYSALRFAVEFFRSECVSLGSSGLTWAHVMAIGTIIFGLICMRILGVREMKEQGHW